MINNKEEFYAYIRKDDNNYFKVEDECEKILITSCTYKDVRKIRTNANKNDATIFKFILEGDKYVIYVKDTDLQYVNIFRFRNIYFFKKLIDFGGGICDMTCTLLNNIGDDYFICVKHWIIKEADNNIKLAENNFKWNCNNIIRLVNYNEDNYIINKEGKINQALNRENRLNENYHLTLEYVIPNN